MPPLHANQRNQRQQPQTGLDRHRLVGHQNDYQHHQRDLGNRRPPVKAEGEERPHRDGKEPARDGKPRRGGRGQPAAQECRNHPRRTVARSTLPPGAIDREQGIGVDQQPGQADREPGGQRRPREPCPGAHPAAAHGQQTDGYEHDQGIAARTDGKPEDETGHRHPASSPGQQRGRGKQDPEQVDRDETGENQHRAERHVGGPPGRTRNRRHRDDDQSHHHDGDQDRPEREVPLLLDERGAVRDHQSDQPHHQS